MKSLILIAVTIFAAQIAKAQNFNSVSVNKEKHTLSFSVKNEVNVSYYLLLAGNEKDDLTPIDRIKAKGNSVMPIHYNNTVFDAAYNYYQIAQVKNDGQRLLSDITNFNTNPNHKILPQPANNHRGDIATSN